MPAQHGVERFTRDGLYLDQHRQELLERYPDQWVAVYNQEVVGAAKDPKQLVRQLKRRGIPPGETYWERLSTEEEVWILAVSVGARIPRSLRPVHRRALTTRHAS
jgi:hypothetical protein